MATSAWGQDLHLMIGSVIDAANVSKLPNLTFWYAIVLQYLQPQCGHMFESSTGTLETNFEPMQGSYYGEQGTDCKHQSAIKSRYIPQQWHSAIIKILGPIGSLRFFQA